MDKPWVTPSFRNVVKSRHRAFLAGNSVLYYRLRNRTQRMANKLRKKYFETKVEQLHASHPHPSPSNMSFTDITTDQVTGSSLPDISTNSADMQGSFHFAEFSSVSLERSLTSTPVPKS